MIRYRVRHRTDYRYGAPVTDGYTVACLLVRDRRHQQVVSTHVAADPIPDEVDERIDVFGNRVVQLGVHRRHEAFSLMAESVVDVEPQPVPPTDVAWETAALQARAARGETAIKIGPYRAATTASWPQYRMDLLDELAGEIFTPGRPVVEAVMALSSTIFATFEFDPTATDVSTPLDLVLANRRGVCQDFAHLAIAAARHVGLPSSYVSGYIETDPPPGQPKSIGADASHAWCSFWIPEHGWFDTDPTNDQAPPTRHVTVGWGRDYADVAPVRGVVIGPNAHQEMYVSVDVARVS